MFAIVRMEKLKTREKLSQRARHHLREAEVQNADEGRTAQNQTTWKKGAGELVEAIWERTEKLVRRKDNVRAIEVLLTASPEWWDTPEKAVILAKEGSKFTRELFGAENVLGIGVHMDEKSPHVWALVTPIHDGKLKASQWLDGPKKLSEIQSKWAEKMAPYGLQRGIKGSKAKHIKISTYYAAVNGDEQAAEYVAREQARRAAWHRARAEEEMSKIEEKRRQLVEAIEELPIADRDRVAEKLGMKQEPKRSEKMAILEGRGARVTPLAPSQTMKKLGNLPTI